MGLTGAPDLSCFVDLAHDPALLVSPGLQLVMLTNPQLVTLVCARPSGKWPWWCIKNEELSSTHSFAIMCHKYFLTLTVRPWLHNG